MKTLHPLLRGSRFLFVLSMLCSAASALCDMLSPQIIRVAVDVVLGDSAPEGVLATALAGHLTGMGACALAILLVALTKAFAQYGFRVANTAASERLVKTARDQLFEHIEHLPYSWHTQHRTGDIIQRCTSDLETLRGFKSEQMTGLLRIQILLTRSVVFMFSMNTKLSVVALSPVPVIIAYSFFFHRKIGEAFLACDENEGILSSIAQENLAGVRVVRAFGRERFERDRFYRQNEHYTQMWMKLARPLASFWSIGDVLSGTQILLTVCYGAVLCVRGEMLPGAYIAFLSYAALMTWPVRMLGRMISQMSKAGVSLDRLSEILNAEVEKNPENPATTDYSGDITFEGVSFSYGGRDVLSNLSFTVPGGTTLGILGGTGSGKSTVTLLLDRLYAPDRGSIRIGGVDLQDLDAAELRRHVSMVLQEPFLFSRSLADNIAISGGDDAEEALRAACLTDVDPGTFVGERGVTLSGGQKQRAAIARALVRDTPILVLDDSLSAVDTETDAAIRANLREKGSGRTVIIISHRIATLRTADHILVLDDGHVVQEGSHAELSRQPGLYRQVCEIQEMTA